MNRRLSALRESALLSPSASEMRRILDIPVALPPEPEEVEYVTQRTYLASAFEAGERLFPCQAELILAFRSMPDLGLFAPIPVGWGKTASLAMLANIAYQEQGIPRSLVLLQSSAVDSFRLRHLPWVRHRVSVSVPVHWVAGRPAPQRRAICRRASPGLYVQSFGGLSARDGEDLLDLVRPQVVFVDEAHHLRNPKAARTRRLMQWVERYNARLVVLSGTIAKRSVMDYHRLMAASCRRFCVLPLPDVLAVTWAEALDAGAAPSLRTLEGLEPLVDWARERFPSALEGCPDPESRLHAAYRARLWTCPAVVASSEQELGVSLIIRLNEPEEDCLGWDRLQELIEQVQGGVSPSGDEIPAAPLKWKWLRELSAGFYNEKYWPTADALAAAVGTNPVEAAQSILLSERAWEIKQEYEKLLRDWLERRSRPGLDTPMLVGSSMKRNGAREVGSQLYSAWQRARDAAGKPGVFERWSRVVRVCPYKIDAAAAWARQHKTGMIWYHHQEVGRWLVETLKDLDLDVVHCPAGANQQVEDEANASRLVVASISAHGTAKQLQYHHRSLVVEWPRGQDAAEQMLGRQHRQGQIADEVDCTRLALGWWDDMLFAACLNDSVWYQSSSGLRQRLPTAEHDPLPRLFDPETLRRAGLENELLDKNQRRYLAEQFGHEIQAR